MTAGRSTARHHERCGGFKVRSCDLEIITALRGNASAAFCCAGDPPARCRCGRVDQRSYNVYCRKQPIGGYVRAAAITFIFLFLLPFQAQAQVVELTLSCEYKSTYDPTAGLEEKLSGTFSAVVRMTPPALARIEATTPGCFDYDGSFSEQEVYGDCERSISNIKTKKSLRINRINGRFKETSLIGKSFSIHDGHCVMKKKLF